MESDGVDELDLQLLRALELDARAPFSRIAGVLGVSDQTVARRYRALRATAGLRVVGVRDHERLGEEHWMLRLRCAPDTAEAIAQALARRPDTTWVGLTSGGTEVILHVRPRSRDEHDELLMGKLPRTPRIVEIRAHQTLHRFFGGPQGWFAKHRILDADQVDALRPGPPPAPAQGPARITADDEPLVRALERDGRATHAELHQATGLSESAVKRRLDALTRSGALFIDVEFDTEPLGYRSVSLLSITAEPRALDRVGRAIATHPEVAYAAATTGPSNLMAIAITRDSSHLYAYLSGSLGALDGVQHVETAPFMRRVKRLTYPLPRT